MRTLLIGIDSGTQSTKALVVDANTGKVAGSGAQAYDLIPDLPPGAKEQNPQTWIDAAAAAIRQALRQAKAKSSEVVAIGVSGQQHGFVPLDAAGAVIRPAKLWCDTSTAVECEEIMKAMGGTKAMLFLVVGLVPVDAVKRASKTCMCASHAQSAVAGIKLRPGLRPAPVLQTARPAPARYAGPR